MDKTPEIDARIDAGSADEPEYNCDDLEKSWGPNYFQCLSTSNCINKKWIQMKYYKCSDENKICCENPVLESTWAQ
jgi:hypothetical protein